MNFVETDMLILKAWEFSKSKIVFKVFGADFNFHFRVIAVRGLNSNPFFFFIIIELNWKSKLVVLNRVPASRITSPLMRSTI